MIDYFESLRFSILIRGNKWVGQFSPLRRIKLLRQAPLDKGSLSCVTVEQRSIWEFLRFFSGTKSPQLLKVGDSP